MRVVNTSFPFDEAGPWALSQRYLPHALLCQALIVQEQMLFPEAANLLYKVGIYFYWRAQYPEVEPLFPQALGIQEHLFGPEHPNTANSLDSLASLYHKQGQDEQAERSDCYALRGSYTALTHSLHDPILDRRDWLGNINKG